MLQHKSVSFETSFAPFAIGFFLPHLMFGVEVYLTESANNSGEIQMKPITIHSHYFYTSGRVSIVSLLLERYSRSPTGVMQQPVCVCVCVCVCATHTGDHFNSLAQTTSSRLGLIIRLANACAIYSLCIKLGYTHGNKWRVANGRQTNKQIALQLCCVVSILN